MDHYFALIKGDEAFLNAEDEHHLVNVKRAQINEEIELSAVDGVHLGHIISLHPLRIQALPTSLPSRETSLHLILAFSLLKNSHDELVLQKGTELGVSEFYPFYSERTIIDLDQKGKQKRLERFNKIVMEAASQSRRDIIPSVNPILPFSSILNLNATKKLFAYEDVAMEGERLDIAIKDLKLHDSVLGVIGPEGGFSVKEAQLASSKGFTYVSLGKRILRAETASIAFCSVCSLKGDEL
jgi:16S rRNA (uracil1498-N3)-methyltransferase